ncbi:enhancer of mRNA-decapping protein 3-like isoform X2 [Glandiceps talaboti]
MSAGDIKDLKILKTAEEVDLEQKEKEKKKKAYVVRATPKKAKSTELTGIRNGSIENNGSVQSDNNNSGSAQNGINILPKKVSNNTFQSSSTGLKGEKIHSHSYGNPNQSHTPGKGKPSDFLRRSDTAPSKLSSSCPESTDRYNGSRGNNDVMTLKKENSSDTNDSAVTFSVRRHDSGESRGQYKKSQRATTDDYLETGKTSTFTRRRNNSVSSVEARKKAASSAPRAIESGRNSQKMRARDAACFSAPIDDTYKTEFDFEKNLALFDKAAVFEEINQSHTKDDLTLEMINRRKKNYRHDENVLDPQPLALKDIVVPQSIGQKSYNSPHGVSIPTIQYETREKLFATAEKCGLNTAKRMELVGLAGSQVSIAVLGGHSRLTPYNSHQRPTIVVLCGPHFYGAQGISCARHLANQDVDVTVFLPSFVKMAECLTTEVDIYRQTGGALTSCVKDLSNSTIDLIINALDCQENSFLQDQQWYQDITAWANNSKAAVLGLDPPCQQMIDARFTLTAALPLPITHNLGTLYLCDVGIPKKVFQEVGIQYVSPFGGKLYLQLT